MQIVIDEIDHALYADVVFSPSELKRLNQAETLHAEVIFKRRKCYVGIRLQGAWDYDEPTLKEEKCH